MLKLSNILFRTPTKFLNERLVSGQKTICMDADLHFDVLAIQQYATTKGNCTARARKAD